MIVYPLSFCSPSFAFTGVLFLPLNFNQKHIPRRFGAELFMDFLRIYVSNEALSEDTIQITLQLDEPGVGLNLLLT